MKRLFGCVAILALWARPTACGQEIAAVNPILDVAMDMDAVVVRLAKTITGEPTQAKQKTVIKKLDDLIAQLEKECAACRAAGASGANPTRPLADSRIIGGPGGIGDLHAARVAGKKWGELPPHERDRILQSMTEGFPAHYQTILERYFRRLAEEKPANAAADQAQPKEPRGNKLPNSTH
jgi:hypothetical protein